MSLLRTGWKTTEFWVAAISAIFVAIQQQLWPDKPFPTVEFSAIVTWIIARTGEKILTSGNPGKRPWQTSEFWVATGFAVVSQFVTIPASIINLVYVWIVGRPAVKLSEGLDLKGILGKK